MSSWELSAFYAVALFTEVNQAELETNHGPPPFGAKDKSKWRYTSFPQDSFMTQCFIKHNVTSTLFFLLACDWCLSVPTLVHIREVPEQCSGNSASSTVRLSLHVLVMRFSLCKEMQI